MKLTSQSFADGGPIPPTYAFCAPDAATHAKLSDNLNPHLAWSETPMGVKSYALVCHDPDVPSKADDVNKEGRVVPSSLARIDFFHWVLVDIPAAAVSVMEGGHSSGVVARGKPGPQAPDGARHGLNDYTKWFAGDNDMAGDYYGYDGPCPPWNDERPHRYVFTVYALDVEKLAVSGAFRGDDVRKAVQGHVLAQASLTGRYTLNPAVKV